ncbi:MAG: ricin-type beta-trefoil lectin domain protein [Deltaproteobacteria bacterium]|nr:ricin-type beta-trefoil lectin domain protein [Deltaproteobacteria bacterium]
MKTTTKVGIVAMLTTALAMGCAAPTQEAEAPISSAAESPDTTPPVPDDDPSNIAEARGSMLDRSNVVDDALRAAGLDPFEARREAEAIRTASEKDRAPLVAEFSRKYAAVARSVESQLPGARETSAGSSIRPVEGPRIGQDVAFELPEMSTTDRTACATATQTTYSSSSPPVPSTSVDARFMSVLATHGAAGASTNDSSKTSWMFPVTPAPSTSTVTATFRLETGHLEVWSGLFGYADGGVQLRLDVTTATGEPFCSNVLTIRQAQNVAEHTNEALVPATHTVRCSNTRARDTSTGLRAKLTLRAWAGAGGIAGAHARATGRLLSIGFSNCVEDGAFYDAEGLCVKPVGTAIGSSTRLEECDTSTAANWSFDGTIIRHRATGLCLSVEPTGTISSSTPVALRTCSTSLRQRWIRAANGQVQSAAAAGFCLDGSGGGGVGSTLFMWPCLTPAGKNQRWFFEP